MADTLPDVILTKTSYQNLFTETGLSAGTSLLVQNKSLGIVILQIGTQPAATDTNGVFLQPEEFIVVNAGESAVWASGLGNISVQDNT